MQTTKLSSKGQLVLPKFICITHHWKPGTEFAIEERDDGVFLRPIKPMKKTSWEQLQGCVNYKGKAKSLEDMQKAIAKGVKERHARGRY